VLSLLIRLEVFIATEIWDLPKDEKQEPEILVERLFFMDFAKILLFQEGILLTKSQGI